MKSSDPCKETAVYSFVVSAFTPPRGPKADGQEQTHDIQMNDSLSDSSRVNQKHITVSVTDAAPGFHELIVAACAYSPESAQVAAPAKSYR